MNEWQTRLRIDAKPERKRTARLSARDLGTRSCAHGERGRASWPLCLLAVSLSATVAPAAAATAICGKGEIPNVVGEARVTPSTPVGTLLGKQVTATSLVRNICEYDVGTEEEATAWSEEKGITLVLRPTARFRKVESSIGYVVSLPDITDRIGVGLKLISANGVMLTGSEDEIVIGHAPKEAGVVGYFFDGSKVSVFPTGTRLSYQAVKVKPSSESGVFYLSNYVDMFQVDWYVDYYNAGKRLILTTPIDMMLGIGTPPLKINVSGCSLGSLRETLPKTPKSSFSGVGSTSDAMKSFNLQVTCRGTTLVKLSINANNPFTSGVGVGQPAATSGEATAGSGGMGIQLLSGASGETPWNFDNAMTLNEANVGESGNTAFAIPLRARYYQTATSVRPGRLTVGFTVTFTYE